MILTEQHARWALKRKQGASPAVLKSLLLNQKGRCALSGVEMLFDSTAGTPIAGGQGCHPLYAAADHVDPENPHGGYQIVCYALNDLKGHLPPDCFDALSKTPAWLSLMKKKLIHPGISSFFSHKRSRSLGGCLAYSISSNSGACVIDSI